MRIETTMTNQHPITPPQELVDQWSEEWHHSKISDTVDLDNHLATQAAQWGADQELEACCRWIEDQLCMPPNARADVITQLDAARRPKPPSLKEQALTRTDAILNDPGRALSVELRETLELNRRALEALDD